LVYAIHIRDDKPYVLDFSHAPEVVFTSPAKGDVFHPGDEAKVAAVLTDPKRAPRPKKVPGYGPADGEARGAVRVAS